MGAYSKGVGAQWSEGLLWTPGDSQNNIGNPESTVKPTVNYKSAAQNQKPQSDGQKHIQNLENPYMDPLRYVITPGELNQKFGETGVYNSQGDIVWDKVKEALPEVEVTVASSVKGELTITPLSPL